MALLQHILHTQNRSAEWVRHLAWFMGILMMFLSIQCYHDGILLIRADRQQGDSQFTIINKIITNEMMGHSEKTIFDNSDIQTIRNTSFIEQFDSIQSNEFGILAETDGNLGFSTQLFFEAVPDSFLDIRPDNWHWRENETTLPIILSKDFLNLYNFGFALSQGLPQMSETTIQQLGFRITIYNQQSKQQFNAVVAGFTKRYSSVLVPPSFMQYANLHFGMGQHKRPSRLILKTAAADQTQLQAFLQQQGYTSSIEANSHRQASFILKLIFGTSGLLALFILVLSLTLILQNIRIQMAEARDTLKTLFRLGYSPQRLANTLLKPILRQLVITLLLALLSTQIVQWLAMQMLKPYQLTIPSLLTWPVLTFALFTTVVLFYFLQKKSKAAIQQYL